MRLQGPRQPRAKSAPTPVTCASQGSDAIAKELIRRACNRTFLGRAGEVDAEPVERIVTWFDTGQALKISGDETSDLCLKAFRVVPGLVAVAEMITGGPDTDAGTLVTGCELVLEALAAQKRISRSEEFGWTALRAPRHDKRRDVDD